VLLNAGLIASSAASELWTPAEITTALWLDADDSATITESSGSVSQWDDKSGNSNDVSQGSASERPQILSSHVNGLDVISFDGTEGLEGSSLSGYGSKLTLFFAGELNSSGDRIVSDDITGTQGYFIWYQERLAINDGAGHETHSVSIPVNSPVVVVVVIDLTTSDLIVDIDGTASTNMLSGLTGTISTPNSAGLGIFSSGNGAQQSTGECYEIGVIHDALSTDDRANLIGYLAHKWGLTANLPGGHPYKTSAPTV